MAEVAARGRRAPQAPELERATPAQQPAAAAQARERAARAERSGSLLPEKLPWVVFEVAQHFLQVVVQGFVHH